MMLLALTGARLDQQEVPHAAWLLSSLHAYIACPYVNQELQRRAMKRGEGKSDQSKLLPLRTTVTTLLGFASTRPWE